MSDKTIQTKTLILGAGLTGVACGLHLKGQHLIAEKESEPGGIVRSRLKEGGFLCDGTGHWLHLRNPRTRDLVRNALGENVVEYERRAAIHSKGVFTLFPFQANLDGLPREVVLECLKELWKARHPEDFGASPPEHPPRSFAECIIRLFGEGIARHFMTPYNEKLLGVPLEEVSPRYAERFVPKPSVEDILNGAFGHSKESLGYNATFIYPKEGGIGALPKALEKGMTTKPRYNVSVTSVDPLAKTANLSTGETVCYEHLVNTMPLIDFLRLCGGLPESVTSAAAKLRATTVHYFDLGVRGPGAEGSGKHWVYFPEPEFVFYRVGSYSAVHPALAPEGCRSYYVEISGGFEAYRDRPEELKERVIRDLIRGRILSEQDEILLMELCKIPHAYVVFDREYEAARLQVLEGLARFDIRSCGRWGGWNYGGMEDAMLEGIQAAEEINAASNRE
ncbi:MAG: protoporphyrinogen/coproporphyrinogen oxidase [Verrucomicrobiales bacterium]